MTAWAFLAKYFRRRSHLALFSSGGAGVPPVETLNAFDEARFDIKNENAHGRDARATTADKHHC